MRDEGEGLCEVAIANAGVDEEGDVEEVSELVVLVKDKARAVPVLEKRIRGVRPCCETLVETRETVVEERVERVGERGEVSGQGSRGLVKRQKRRVGRLGERREGRREMVRLCFECCGLCKEGWEGKGREMVEIRVWADDEEIGERGHGIG